MRRDPLALTIHKVCQTHVSLRTLLLHPKHVVKERACTNTRENTHFSLYVGWAQVLTHVLTLLYFLARGPFFVEFSPFGQIVFGKLASTTRFNLQNMEYFVFRFAVTHPIVPPIVVTFHGVHR